MAGDDGAALAGGERIAESSGFSVDRNDRRKGVPQAGAAVGTGFPGGQNSNGQCLN